MTPTTEAEMAEAIASARGPLRIVGGGTRPVGNPVMGEMLAVAGLTGIQLYEPGALTIVVKAGTPLDEVEAALAAENQRLPFEPMDHRLLLGTDGVPTVGGMAAANASGPRRIQVGACRDFMLGVRFIDGAGHVLKNGGRVMKNVTGYDLVKLMAGSHGTLGVLTEVAFKVLPAVEARAVLLIEGLTDGDAVRAMAVALASPFEVSGAAHTQKGHDGTPVTMVRLEGFAASVAYRADRLKDMLGGFGEITVETDPDKTAVGWRWVRDVAPFRDGGGDVWRVSVKASEAPGLVARVPGTEALYDWGGGLVWLRVPEGQDLRAKLSGFAGRATLVRSSDETRARLGAFHPEPAPLAAVSKGLRARFDPRGILNPGLMG